MALGRELRDYLAGLVRLRHAEPGDDLLSSLVRTGELSDDELVTIAVTLLIAGHEATADQIANFTYLLLTHPAERRRLQANRRRRRRAGYTHAVAAYDFRCRACDRVFEVRHAVTEHPTDVRCPSGHDDVARVWSAVAIAGRSGPAAPAPPAAGGCCGGGCCG